MLSVGVIDLLVLNPDSLLYAEGEPGFEAIIGHVLFAPLFISNVLVKTLA